VQNKLLAVFFSGIVGIEVKFWHQMPSIMGFISLIALIQRVTSAQVQVSGEIVGRIGPGMLALIGVKPADDEVAAARLLARMLRYRIFADDAGKMNLNLSQINGELLLVPQFTLAADTSTGLRPGFSTAAPPEQGKRLFDYLLSLAKTELPGLQTGIFGANMQVSLTNDGPVTIWLES
jgi:D-tyrosyl-tRNA(Tyr) deacylase